jgi:hypothetical protein
VGGAKLWLNKKLTNKTLSLIKDSLYEWSLITNYTSKDALAKERAAEKQGP